MFFKNLLIFIYFLDEEWIKGMVMANTTCQCIGDASGNAKHRPPRSSFLRSLFFLCWLYQFVSNLWQGETNSIWIPHLLKHIISSWTYAKWVFFSEWGDCLLQWYLHLQYSFTDDRNLAYVKEKSNKQSYCNMNQTLLPPATIA